MMKFYNFFDDSPWTHVNPVLTNYDDKMWVLNYEMWIIEIMHVVMELIRHEVHCFESKSIMFLWLIIVKGVLT